MDPPTTSPESIVKQPVGTTRLRAVLVSCMLAAFPALHVAVANPGQVSMQGLAVVLAGTVAAALALLGLLRLAGHGWSTALLAAAGFVLLTFSYGPLRDWLDANVPMTAVGAPADLPFAARIFSENLLGFWAVLAGSWLLLARRVGAAQAANLAMVFSVVAALLYVSMLARAGVHAFGHSDVRLVASAQAGHARPAASAVGYDPDVYYIVLDGYARADVLQKYYADDNSRFLDALRQRGFVVAATSSANYYWTFLSLVSSLNYQYLDSLVGHPTAAQLQDWRPFSRAIRDNEAARFLRNRGYRYVHFQSTWGGTLRNEFADREISCEKTLFRDDYTRAVIGLTPLRALESKMAADLADCHRSHFASLAALGAERGPKFVLAHFLLPHHPYLFDRQGRTLRSATISDQFEFQKKLWERRDLYLDQLEYVNARVLEAVDAILAASNRPPIILIQSDHGPNLQEGLSVAEQRAVRFATLSVALLPGAPPGLLPEGDTSVNKLPRVFNFYFDAGLPLRPSQHYYSSFTAPLELERVALDPVPRDLRQARLEGGS